MAELMVSGSERKQGIIQISGAKNGALPLMAACLLTKEDVKLQNVPNISDVESLRKQLESFGVKVCGDGNETSPLVLNAAHASFAPSENGYNPTRGGFTVLGPLIARFGEAKVLVPGGCEIGGETGRPVDFHIDALVEMGAEKVPSNEAKYIWLKAKHGLKGKHIKLPEVSVGATENIMMAACLAAGVTIIEKAAVEPEVVDLVVMLREMGAKIEIEAEEEINKITIHGKPSEPKGKRKFLSGATHTVIPDRIEAGSYAIAAGIAGGPLLLKMDRSAEEMLAIVVKKLVDAGVQATWQHDGLQVQRSGVIRAVDITTGPYPELFPTDLLPQWVTFMTQAQGKSRIEDTVFGKRFQHVQDLKNMGASVTQESDKVIIIHGGANLQGKHVKAKDLRGGFALILAGMAAAGSTVVKEIQHVRRGYENIKEKLAQCGAKLEQLPAPPRGHYGHPPQ